MGSWHEIFWRKDPTRRRILIICVLTDAALASLVPFVNLYMSDELRAPSELTGLTFGGYLAVETFFKAPAGALSDRWGRKTVLTLGLSIGAICSGLIGTCAAYQPLLYLFPLAGLSVAAVFPALAAYIADTTEEAERSAVMGVLNLSYMAGLAASAAGGFFLHGLVGTYRYSFFGTATVLTMALLFTLFLLPARPPERSLIRRRTDRVRVRLRALSPPLLTLALVIGLAQFGVAMLVPVIVPFAKKVVRLTDAHMGIGVVVATTVWALASVPCARLSDRFGREQMIRLGLLSGSLCLLAIPPTGALQWFFVLLLIVLLAGSAWLLGFPATLALASELVREEEKGTAVGLIYGGQGAGASLGAPAGGLFHKAALALTQDEKFSLAFPFFAASLSLLLASAMTLFLSHQIRSWSAVKRNPDDPPMSC